MAIEFDINEEYKKIFGVENRPNLFSSDDEAYRALRQEIVEARREFNNRKSLPFEGLRLLSYDDFKRAEIVREAEKQGNRIFCIQKYEKSKLISYAAGYYNAEYSCFVVLRDSFFIRNEYVKHLLANEHLPVSKMYYSIVDDFVRIKQNHSYPSASLAASYVLGEKASFHEWKDERGKTLDAYYLKYKDPKIVELEEKTFPAYYASIPSSMLESALCTNDNNIKTIMELVLDLDNLMPDTSNLNVADVEKLTVQQAEYTQNMGFNDQYYRNLIIDALKRYRKLARKDIYSLLVHKLPNSLDDKQKMNKIGLLLRQLREAGKIQVGEKKLWQLV